jgi:HTH-type transcriptional regulator/antitoxin HigA
MIKKNGKMTITFNADIYGNLLAKYRPKVILTEEENEKAITKWSGAIALAEELEHIPNRTLEEDELLELLIALIEKFEDENYYFPESNPSSILLHLMEANNLKKEDLVAIIGEKNVLDDLIKEKVNTNLILAKTLADFFKVDIQLFLS